VGWWFSLLAWFLIWLHGLGLRFILIGRKRLGRRLNWKGWFWKRLCNPRLFCRDSAGVAWKLDDEVFEVSARSRYGVRHELAHIYEGHLDLGNLSERKGIQKVIGNILYHVYYEPVATLHGVGIKR